MKVMVLGATGLTGAAVVEKLLERPEVTSVIAPVRRRVGSEHSKLIQQQVDFDDLQASADLFAVDAIVCCLGTTIKKAGSREQFRAVDFGYSLEAARLGRAAGARAFILMSAIGASSDSTIFYNRVKGELEDAVRELSYPYLSVYHPSLLLGERQEQRTAEGVGIKLMPLVNRVLLGPLEKFRGVQASTVAQAMVNEVCLLEPESLTEPVQHLRDYPEILRLAG
ncbi:nucleoside-diphosphate sugar epimerase [Marinobacter similis]|uniref:Nucleoside-diphosphate sugar epimerase n=2 Tax=Marinobacter similis TaxID=1420916 RepID=W5YPC1_9GAMM|nr:nucleoside-diphosphate sugar epimerase [Marinobacter similis]